MKKIIYRILLLVFSFCALPVHAQLTGSNSQNKLETVARGALGSTPQSDLGNIVGVIIQAILGLVGVIFLVLTVYAGILWMTARGEDDQITKAKNILKGSIIGLVITVSAYAITYFVTSRLGAI